MPPALALATAGYGAAYGLLPIGWIVLNVIFLYQLTSDAGLFATLRHSITAVTRDARLQLLLVAFCFGAFFEGAAGFGTPVAITGALLIGLGFTPLAASGLSLIANTAPVAFGALGTPIIALQGVTKLDLFELSAMVGRQLPFFSLIVPFWLIWAYAGRRGMLGGLAGDSRRRRVVRDPAVPRLELPRSVAGGHPGGDRIDCRGRARSCRVWQPSDQFVAADDGDRQRDDRAGGRRRRAPRSFARGCRG